MDEQQQQRLNQAAEQFANAIRDSFSSASRAWHLGPGDEGSAYPGLLQPRHRKPAHPGSEHPAAGTAVTCEQQRLTEAGRTLTLETVDPYTDFVNSMFSFAQRSAEQDSRQT